MGTTPREAASLVLASEHVLELEDSDSDLHRTGESKPPLNGGKEAGGEAQRRGRLSVAGVAAGDREEGGRRKPGLPQQVAGSLSSKPVLVTLNKPNGFHLDV